MLHFLAIDTHGPLVALSDTHLVAAALHVLAWVLGGVRGCKHKTNSPSRCVNHSSGVFILYLFISSPPAGEKPQNLLLLVIHVLTRLTCWTVGIKKKELYDQGLCIYTIYNDLLSLPSYVSFSKAHAIKIMKCVMKNILAVCRNESIDFTVSTAENMDAWLSLARQPIVNSTACSLQRLSLIARKPDSADWASLSLGLSHLTSHMSTYHCLSPACLFPLSH